MSEQPGTVAVIGATSAIARALAGELAAAGWSLILASRDADDLQRTADDLRVRQGAVAHPIRLDVADFASHADFVARCLEAAGDSLRGVVYFSGYMADQRQAERDPALARQTIDVNYTGAVLLLNRFAEQLQKHRGSFICGIGSVAGDRGRQSNYIYGSTKAAFAVYLDGLRHHLFASGVRVIAIKLGFVDTAMTWGLIKADSPLVASPQRAARIIYKHMQHGSGTWYVPRIWQLVMFIIRSVPDFIFHRSKL